MLQSIKHWLFILFHFHEWEVVEQGTISRRIDRSVRATWYLQKCKHCGKLQEKQFEA
jgi:uncharacterized protein CbrC (UPF0167 family)